MADKARKGIKARRSAAHKRTRKYERQYARTADNKSRRIAKALGKDVKKNTLPWNHYTDKPIPSSRAMRGRTKRLKRA